MQKSLAFCKFLICDFICKTKYTALVRRNSVFFYNTRSKAMQFDEIFRTIFQVQVCHLKFSKLAEYNVLGFNNARDISKP